jgi:acetylxylan esterase
MDNAVCGGPDSGSGITSTTSPINASAHEQIKAVILMGSPRYVAGLSYNVGTCTAQGVSSPSSPSSIPIIQAHPYHPINPLLLKY